MSEDKWEDFKRCIRNFVRNKCDAVNFKITTKAVSIKPSVSNPQLAQLWNILLKNRLHFSVDKNQLEGKMENLNFTVYITTGTLLIQGAAKYIDGLNEMFKSLIREYRMLSDQARVGDAATSHAGGAGDRQKESSSATGTSLAGGAGDRQKESSSARTTHAGGAGDRQKESSSAKKYEDEVDRVTEGLDTMSLEPSSPKDLKQRPSKAFVPTLWTDEELDEQMKRLPGAVINEELYIYKLWLSLLQHWLQMKSAKVYLVSPFLDTARLADIVYCCLESPLNLQALYTRAKQKHFFKDQNITNIMEEAKRLFPTKYHYDIRCIYNKIVYEGPRFHCKFMAVVEGGMASVLITSANFTESHFIYPNTETLVFIRISEDDFQTRFIDPIK